MLTHTYTYAVMKVSRKTYEEVKKKLLAAGYAHALHEHGGDGILLDMRGIALSHRVEANKNAGRKRSRRQK